MATKIDDALTVTGGIVADTPQLITGDGIIVLPASVGMPKVVTLTKGSAAAITLPAPVAGTDDGKIVYIYSETAFAHVVTCAQGFKRKGASGTATATAAADNAFGVVARNGQWDVLSSTNFAFA
jgi:hypothetical protein